MNAIELALKKQRLQVAATAQREALTLHLAGLQPLFNVADQAQAGVRWISRHPEVVAGGVAVLAAARPGARRFIWRWGRRTLVAWQLWRDSERWLDTPPNAHTSRG
jgi:hypothetical protein